LAGYIELARLRQVHGDLPAALSTMDEALELARSSRMLSWDVGRSVAAVRARLLVASGALDAAGDWARAVELPLDAGNDVLRARFMEYLPLAQVLLAQGHYDDALRLLDRLQAALAETGFGGPSIEAHALQALVLRAAGQLAPAVSLLKQALERAAPEGFVRTFVDYGAPIGDLLRAIVRQPGAAPLRPYIVCLLEALNGGSERPWPGLATPAARAVQPLRAVGMVEAPDALSERELDVLRLIATGHSNDEVAQALVVAASTVKWHVKNIYNKLDVHSRVQAVQRARERGLLG
jgi:LuxR family maltose regulon positive regulatory protein